MVVIKLAILKRQRAKDGSYKIRIAIGHKSETAYIVTPYSVSSYSDFHRGVVVRGSNSMAINLELSKLLADYNNRLSRIANPNNYTCKELRKVLLSMRPTATDATLNEIVTEFVSELEQDNRHTYAKVIQNDIAPFTEFMRGDVFLSTITPVTISDYARYLRSRGLTSTSQAFYLSGLRTVINRASRLGRVHYDINPFTNFSMPSSRDRELDVSVEQLRAIRDAETKNFRHAAARDIFMLSYYLGGMNLVDLLAYDFRNPDLDYIRHKTRNTKHGDSRTVFAIQPEARAIIDRYMDKKTGLLVLPFGNNFRTKVSFINRSIKETATNVGIKRRVSPYTARKSFVQHGFDIGISLETLEYCIGQSVKRNRPIFNYVRIMQRHADEAIRKIIDNLNGGETTLKVP